MNRATQPMSSFFCGLFLKPRRTPQTSETATSGASANQAPTETVSQEKSEPAAPKTEEKLDPQTIFERIKKLDSSSIDIKEKQTQFKKLAAQIPIKAKELSEDEMHKCIDDYKNGHFVVPLTQETLSNLTKCFSALPDNYFFFDSIAIKFSEIQSVVDLARKVSGDKELIYKVTNIRNIKNKKVDNFHCDLLPTKKQKEKNKEFKYRSGIRMLLTLPNTPENTTPPGTIYINSDQYKNVDFINKKTGEKTNIADYSRNDLAKILSGQELYDYDVIPQENCEQKYTPCGVATMHAYLPNCCQEDGCAIPETAIFSLHKGPKYDFKRHLMVFDFTSIINETP